MGISAHSNLSQWYRPAIPRGKRIGLLLGSFDPPHDGHFVIAKSAKRILNLDNVWWCISPGNPHKPPPRLTLADRVKRCQDITRNHKRFHTPVVLESDLKTSTTADFLRRLTMKDRREFVVIMGSDTFIGVHKWSNWNAMTKRVHLLIYPRPNTSLLVTRSLAGQKLRGQRRKVSLLRRCMGQHKRNSLWSIANFPTATQLLSVSSSQLRAKMAYPYLKE